MSKQRATASASVTTSIADVQSSADTRRIAIDKVGIKDIRHPVRVKDRSEGEQHTVANFNMYVNLPHNFKGTHMSRFVEILNLHEREISVESFKVMLGEMTERLEAEAGHIEMSFPYFVNKTAPVSGVQSLLDYEVSFIGEIRDSEPQMKIKVVVPVTSLCPCSKKISERGAHNQRSHVTVTATTRDFIWIEELIEMVEGPGIQRTLRPAQAPGRKVRHRKSLRQSQVCRGHGARHRSRPERRRSHQCLRGGIGKLRVHTQPLGLRPYRTQQGIGPGAYHRLGAGTRPVPGNQQGLAMGRLRTHTPK